MNHWKIPTYILKILKLLWKFGTSDTSSGPRDTMGKGLETAVVKKAGPQGGSGMAARLCYGFSSRSSSCWGPGRPAGHPGATGKPAGPRPRHPSAWLGWGGGVGFWFWFLGWFFFFSLLCERRNRKHDSFSNWLTQTLWDKPWTPRWREALVWPQSWKHQRKSHASYSAWADLLGVLWPTPTAVPTPSPLLSSKRYVFLVSLFSFDWNDTI